MKNLMYNEMGKNLVSVVGPLDTHLQNDECWGVNAAMVYWAWSQLCEISSWGPVPALTT